MPSPPFFGILDLKEKEKETPESWRIFSIPIRSYSKWH
jgi:hypothetical protein